MPGRARAAGPRLARHPSDPALRTGTVHLPLDWRDPSEMIRSGRIVPQIEGVFEVLHCRPCRWSLLFPLLCAVHVERKPAG